MKYLFFLLYGIAIALTCWLLALCVVVFWPLLRGWPYELQGYTIMVAAWYGGWLGANIFLYLVREQRRRVQERLEQRELKHTAWQREVNVDDVLPEELQSIAAFRAKALASIQQ